MKNLRVKIGTNLPELSLVRAEACQELNNNVQNNLLVSYWTLAHAVDPQNRLAVRVGARTPGEIEHLHETPSLRVSTHEIPTGARAS